MTAHEKKLLEDAAKHAGRAVSAYYIAARYFRGKGGYGWDWTSRKARLVTAGILAASGTYYLALSGASLLLADQAKKERLQIEAILKGEDFEKVHDSRIEALKKRFLG